MEWESLFVGVKSFDLHVALTESYVESFVRALA